MNAWSKFAAVTMAGCLSALVAGTANAAEITVVAGGGPLPDVMGTLVPMFESATGNKVKISFKGGPAITADLKQGAADLVITGTEQVETLGDCTDESSILEWQPARNVEHCRAHAQRLLLGGLHQYPAQ